MPFRNKSGGTRDKGRFFSLPLCLCLLGLLLLSSCNRPENRIETGEFHLKKGRYFQALQVYRSLALEYPKNPRVLAGMGRIYSVRRLTAFAGRDYLRRSLELTKNKESKEAQATLKDLLWLLVAMGRFEEALGYLQEPWVNIERLFEPEMFIWRNGLSCLAHPQLPFLQRLAALPDSAADGLDSEKKVFLFLCGSMHKRPSKKTQSLLQNAKINLQKNRKDWCMGLGLKASLGSLSKEEAKDLALCKSEFLGNIVIQREAMRVEKAPESPPWQFTRRGLFFINPFAPEDPGRPDVPPWPKPRDFDL